MRGRGLDRFRRRTLCSEQSSMEVLRMELYVALQYKNSTVGKLYMYARFNQSCVMSPAAQPQADRVVACTIRPQQACGTIISLRACKNKQVCFVPAWHIFRVPTWACAGWLTAAKRCIIRSSWSLSLRMAMLHVFSGAHLRLKG